MPRQVWHWQGCPDINSIDVISGCAMGLITDIAGLRVGQAGDAELASGVTVVVFDAATMAGVGLRGGGPRTRETRRGAPLALGRRGVWARGPLGRAGLFARAGPRLSGPRCARADCARCDPLRPALGRRQELGPLPALSRTRLRGGEECQRHL